jgi:hypothetical protein
MAVMPFQPQIRQLVFHSMTGGSTGHFGGWVLTDQIIVLFPLVCAMKFDQMRALNDWGRK